MMQVWWSLVHAPLSSDCRKYRSAPIHTHVAECRSRKIRGGEAVLRCAPPYFDLCIFGWIILSLILLTDDQKDADVLTDELGNWWHHDRHCTSALANVVVILCRQYMMQTSRVESIHFIHADEQEKLKITVNQYSHFAQTTQHSTHIFIVGSWSSDKPIKVSSTGVTDCSIADCGIELLHSISHIQNTHIAHGSVLIINVMFCIYLTLWLSNKNWITLSTHCPQPINHCAHITFHGYLDYWNYYKVHQKIDHSWWVNLYF